MSNLSQNYRILTHLRTGKPLDPWQAIDRYGCMRLAARIAELREQGHPIEREMVTNKKTGKTWARYRLA
ncbi:MAG: helix-turn-helix domain-containing protein [Ilumatobacteraceae bacterium]